MKIKQIINYLLVALLAIQLVSCDNKEAIDSPFSGTPTERLNAKEKELNDLLMSSELGWKAVYFTDNTQLGGFTHLFKFKDGKVDMASDFNNDTSIQSSEYDIILGSTVSLVFTTKNRIHLLSDSNSFPIASLQGKGYLGDFQFLYYGQENGEIIFRTSRSFQEVRFVKAKATDWTDLAQSRLMVPNVAGATTRPLFRLLEINDGTKVSQFDFNFTSASRFATSNSIETGSSVTNNIGIAYTPTGIIVSPAVKVGSQSLSAFTYDAATGNFNATGTAGVSASIKYSTKPLVLTDDFKGVVNGPRLTYAYINGDLKGAQTNSLLFNNLVAAAKATLLPTQDFNRISLIFNDPVNGTFIQYSFTGGKGAINHYLIAKEDPVNKTIKLTDDGWSMATPPAFLADIDKQILDPAGLYLKKEKFTIRYSNTIYTFTSASSNFRMTTYAL
ncbi:DUF4302 domain-containing protein [Flavobacterium sp. PL12]|uniref:DUF4302 domain-containing protein n=1 Tax=Flavobacterium sp. PL12 TaxID=3071718 RepID=UPI00319DD140